MTDLVVCLAHHRAGFAAEARGDLAAATRAYGQALHGIRRCLADAALAPALEARAARFPGGLGTPASATQTLLLCLPDWLIDVHLARAGTALARKELAVARMHWDLVLAGEGLGRRSYRRSVDDCRAWMETQFFGKLSDAPRARVDQLELAERILVVDPGHDGVRLRVAGAYARSIYSSLELAERAEAGKRQPARVTKIRSSRGVLTRPRISRYARLLKRHAAKLARTQRDAETREELASAFRVLAAYWRQESDRDQAERMQRYVRRIRRPPDNEPAAEHIPAERPREHRPPALDNNPFGTAHNPYDANPLDLLGVDASDEEMTIKLRVDQLSRGSVPDDAMHPRIAQRQLADHALRLTYDLMRLASQPPERGGES